MSRSHGQPKLFDSPFGIFKLYPNSNESLPWITQSKMLVRSWQQFYSYIFTNTSNNGLLQGKQFVTSPQQDTNVLSFNGIVTRVARCVPHVEQELPTLPEHMNSHRFLAGFAMFDLQFSVQCFVDRCLSFFHLSIVLSVLLLFMDSDFPMVSSLYLMPMLCFFKGTCCYKTFIRFLF